ncbi:MAG: hypothetical protein QXL27_09720 [Candidatus Bathyarchaeia archaeon]
MTKHCDSKSRRKKVLEPTIERLLLEALNEENTERAVELFLAARLVRIICEKGLDTFNQFS